MELTTILNSCHLPAPGYDQLAERIAGDVTRGRYRNSIEKPAAIMADQVTHYRIAFPANDHVFLKGHRIMVQVQSTWFPVIDRNPQRFVPNIFNARATDFQKATRKIFRAGQQASYIATPVRGGRRAMNVLFRLRPL